MVNLIARYRAADAKGRHHLVQELTDKQHRHWFELLDGTRLIKYKPNSFASVTGEKFMLIGKD